ncbi:MAG: DNA-binding protein YbiB, partial [Giesbergeria sp.]|nr:DNA-binding protein YbiB [Giesbergeria sp.]
MGISQYIKEIGRGPRGARPLTRAQAADLLGQVLDGGVTDLEIGAFCLAMRIKGETAPEMAGFLDATHQRLARLPASDRPLVVLPSYNGARKLPVLTPLLALLLAREGLPVLLHGMRTEARRVLASDVLVALGTPALTAPEKIAIGCVAHITTATLHPGLARLLAAREVIGLRNPGHSLVKLINPCAGAAVVVSSYT